MMMINLIPTKLELQQDNDYQIDQQIFNHHLDSKCPDDCLECVYETIEMYNKERRRSYEM